MVKVIISGAYATRIMPCLDGYPVDAVGLSHSFKDISGKIGLVLKSDVIHITSIDTTGTDGIKWLLILTLLKLLNKKVILHWVGTDAMNLRWRYGVFLSKLVRKHLVIAPWLIGELHGKGVDAEHLFMPMKLKFSEDELPKEMGVLIYLGDPTRNDFYGSEIFERLVIDMQDVRFLVVGNISYKLNFKNVVYFGWVSGQEMDEIYKQTTVLLRPTKHDGLSNMVLESLARGKYVIWTNRFPHCYYATEYSQIVGYLNELKHITFINNTGIEYVRSNFSSDIWAKKLVKLYGEFGGGK